MKLAFLRVDLATDFKAIRRTWNVPSHKNLIPKRSPVPSPGRSVTQERRLLRKQISKLRVNDPKHGATHKDVSCRQCAKDGAFGGHPAPHVWSLNG